LETVYQVDAWYRKAPIEHRAAYTIVHKNGKETVNIVQTNHGGQWITLGTYHFDSGTTGMFILQ
jgi:hypothetical protein